MKLFINNNTLLKNFFFTFNFFFYKFIYNYFFIIKSLNFFKLIFFFINFTNIFFFFLNKFYYYYYLTLFIFNFKKIINFTIKFSYLTYKFYRFLTFIGLGFKKRLSKLKKNNFFLYFGDRHWIMFFLPVNLVLFYMLYRKSIIFFSKYKWLLKNYLLNFKFFWRESIFKLKGLLDSRLRRKWIFMRRAKIRGLKIKLSKKQKFL